MTVVLSFCNDLLIPWKGSTLALARWEVLRGWTEGKQVGTMSCIWCREAGASHKRYNIAPIVNIEQSRFLKIGHDYNWQQAVTCFETCRTLLFSYCWSMVRDKTFETQWTLLAFATPPHNPPLPNVEPLTRISWQAVPGWLASSQRHREIAKQTFSQKAEILVWPSRSERLL